MKQHQQEQIDWLKKYYGSLEGATINKVSVKVEDDMGWPQLWPVLHVTLKDGSTADLELSQDEEGNGPGFMYGLPLPAPATPSA